MNAVLTPPSYGLRLQYARDGLKAELQRAISNKGTVQIVTGPQDTLKRVPVEQLLSAEMAADDLLALIFNALSKSDCELVKAARDCFVQRVVDAHADDLVTFEYDGWAA